MRYKINSHAQEIIDATETLSCPDRERFLRGYNANQLGTPLHKNPYERKFYQAVWAIGWVIASGRPE